MLIGRDFKTCIGLFLIFSKSRPKTGWQQGAKTDMEERRREVWNKQVQKHKPGIIGKSVTINPDNYSDEINEDYSR